MYKTLSFFLGVVFANQYKLFAWKEAKNFLVQFSKQVLGVRSGGRNWFYGRYSYKQTPGELAGDSISACLFVLLKEKTADKDLETTKTIYHNWVIYRIFYTMRNMSFI